MLGELVAEKAGQAIVEDACSRARRNGCNLLMQPADKLKAALTVSSPEQLFGCHAVQNQQQQQSVTSRVAPNSRTCLERGRHSCMYAPSSYVFSLFVPRMHQAAMFSPVFLGCCSCQVSINAV